MPTGRQPHPDGRFGLDTEGEPVQIEGHPLTIARDRVPTNRILKPRFVSREVGLYLAGAG